MTKQPAQKIDPALEKEYTTLIDLLAVYSEASNQMKDLQSSINEQYLECVDEHKKDYAALQLTMANAEGAIELIALKHPEWFAKRKSLKTPYGGVKQTKSTKLEVANEELSIELLDKEARLNKEFSPGLYVKTVSTLRLEALEQLDDATLARLKIKRVHTENYKVEAIEVDLGKAVEEAAKEAA